VVGIEDQNITEETLTVRERTTGPSLSFGCRLTPFRMTNLLGFLSFRVLGGLSAAVTRQDEKLFGFLAVVCGCLRLSDVSMTIGARPGLPQHQVLSYYLPFSPSLYMYLMAGL
jgi:hypothetical protein